MTTRAHRIFAPVLREVERGMELPIPDRIRILRELEFDLEELWGRLVADGVPAEEARLKALDALVPDAGSLDELDRLHAPLYRRLTSHLSEGRLRFAERLALHRGRHICTTHPNSHPTPGRSPSGSFTLPLAGSGGRRPSLRVGPDRGVPSLDQGRPCPTKTGFGRDSRRIGCDPRPGHRGHDLRPLSHGQRPGKNSRTSRKSYP